MFVMGIFAVETDDGIAGESDADEDTVPNFDIEENASNVNIL